MLRRNLILGGMGLASLGAAEALRPRQKLVLLKDGTMAAALPREFGKWSSQDSDLVNPAQAGRLAQALYSETISRLYYNVDTEAAVMLLIAYGDTQSDLLQLHRPESCYPAVGFTLKSSKPTSLPLGDGHSVPGRLVVATLSDRVETIAYWTRLGERLPQSGGEQRIARLENAMEGYVADGALIRCSALGDIERSVQTMNAFIPQMLRAVSAPHRPAFVGSQLARSIA